MNYKRMKRKTRNGRDNSTVSSMTFFFVTAKKVKDDYLGYSNHRNGK